MLLVGDGRADRHRFERRLGIVDDVARELVERGVLETRKIGARGRVWWRPIPADSVDTQPPRDARQSPETPAEAKHN